MSDNRWYTLIAATLTLTLCAGLFIGFATSGLRGGSAAPVAGSSNAGPNYLALTIAWNPTSGLDEYFPGNFTVPSHTLILFTITNYDDGQNTIAPAYTSDIGVVGSSETITGTAGTQTVHGLPSDAISHTLTIWSAGSGMMGGSGGAPPTAMMNAVIPPAPSPANPVTVTFAAYFNATGSFTWSCMAPCDGGAMATPGLMTGTMSVV